MQLSHLFLEQEVPADFLAGTLEPIAAGGRLAVPSSLCGPLRGLCFSTLWSLLVVAPPASLVLALRQLQLEIHDLFFRSLLPQNLWLCMPLLSALLSLLEVRSAFTGGRRRAEVGRRWCRMLAVHLQQALARKGQANFFQTLEVMDLLLLQVRGLFGPGKFDDQQYLYCAGLKARYLGRGAFVRKTALFGMLSRYLEHLRNCQRSLSASMCRTVLATLRF